MNYDPAFLFLVFAFIMLWSTSYCLMRTTHMMRNGTDAKLADLSRAKTNLLAKEWALVKQLRAEKQKSAALLGTVRSLRREAHRLQAVEVSAAAEAQRIIAQDYGPPYLPLTASASIPDRFWKPICAHGAEHGECLRCAHKVPR
jgi:hypothetical protein